MMNPARTTVFGVQRLLGNLSVISVRSPSFAVARRGLGTQNIWTCSAAARSVNTSWQEPNNLSHPLLLTPCNNLLTRSFSSTGDETKNDKSKTTNTQHQEWIDFQKSIAVQGFETGQTTEVRKTSSRGGKRLSQRKSKEAIKIEKRIAERQRLTDIGGGEYPPLRYSEAETERLLAQAYATIPARTGKRGTRNLKRQKRRWWLVRQIHKKYKKNMMRYQERKMADRSRRVKSVKAVLEAAPTQREKDREYQWQVLQRWTATMYPEKMESKRGQEKV